MFSPETQKAIRFILVKDDVISLLFSSAFQAQVLPVGKNSPYSIVFGPFLFRLLTEGPCVLRKKYLKF